MAAAVRDHRRRGEPVELSREPAHLAGVMPGDTVHLVLRDGCSEGTA